MTTTIALAGKGGVGKTTIAGMVIKYLMQAQSGAILAIDADPSSNLNMILGLDLEWTVGDIREDMLEQVKSSLTAGGAAMGAMSGGMSKRDYLNYEIRSALAEGERFDLIAMGRSEGSGCYCAVNHNLREVIDTISRNYRYVVIDNEAGMEHLSRRTTRDVQHLLVVSDPTQRGLVAAERIDALRADLGIDIENAYLILNRLNGPMPAPLRERIAQLDLPLLGVVPADDELMTFEFSGRPLVSLSPNSPVYLAVAEMMKKII
ncbi:MAG: AAA family ATPase [Candidatus Promineifilaceae bacterium]|nr:AAA family ATPase [Candidatus Promineifilaceae bacterium]